MNQDPSLSVRKAVIADVEKIQTLVNAYAAKGTMLSLSRSEIYDSLRDFFAAESEGAVVGVCALHIIWEDLAEVRSLAVDPCCRTRGAGRALVESCLAEARELQLTRVFVLTYQAAFFEHIGFRVVDKGELPHKVWRDCLKCSKFPDCDETALIIDVEVAA